VQGTFVIVNSSLSEGDAEERRREKGKLRNRQTALSSFFSDPSKFYNADPFIFLAVGLVVLVFGPGKISLDYLIEKRYASRPKFDG